LKFAVFFGPEKKGPDRLVTLHHAERGLLPLIMNTEKPEEAKDGGVLQVSRRFRQKWTGRKTEE
jgi:hypothetical protein